MKGQGISSAFIMTAMRDAFNSDPRKCPALVHHTVRKVLMHKYRLVDRYILFPCLPHPMHTCVGGSIGIGGVLGVLTAASINMCYVRFNSPIMCRSSHFRPYISTTLGGLDIQSPLTTIGNPANALR